MRPGMVSLGDAHPAPRGAAGRTAPAGPLLRRQHAARRDLAATDHLRHDRRRRAGVDVHADVPRRHARHVAVEHVFDASAAAPAAHRDAQHFVFVARPGRDRPAARAPAARAARRAARRCAPPTSTASVDVSPSACTNRRRSISSPGNAMRKLTSRTPFAANDARQRRQLGVQRARRILPPDRRRKVRPRSAPLSGCDEPQRAAGEQRRRLRRFVEHGRESNTTSRAASAPSRGVRSTVPTAMWISWTRSSRSAAGARHHVDDAGRRSHAAERQQPARAELGVHAAAAAA